jgi:hypothetical protein
VIVEQYPAWARLLGVPLIGAALLPMGASLSQRDRLSFLTTVIVHAFPFAMVGLGLATFRQRMVIDRSRREVVSEIGFVVPFLPMHRMPFVEVFEVHFLTSRCLGRRAPVMGTPCSSEHAGTIATGN